MVNTTMNARVLEVGRDFLLVCDCSMGQKVLVYTPQACRFSVGERICIEYNGAMTRSIPPQITAICIWRGCC